MIEGDRPLEAEKVRSLNEEERSKVSNVLPGGKTLLGSVQQLVSRTPRLLIWTWSLGVFQSSPFLYLDPACCLTHKP
jgi:hypothetical protein